MAATSQRTIRDTLFGDAELDQWPAENVADGETWTSFIKARNAFNAGNKAEAIKVWQQITEAPDLESRHYLQAWEFLRAAGVEVPANKAKQLMGVVIEVPMEGGLDLLAAYPERHARYYNYSGAGVVWDRPNNSLDHLIDNLLTSARHILQVIGPWDKPRPPAPAAGNLRINLLSPAGLHFGEGPFGPLAADPMAKPLVDAAIVLIQALMELKG